MNYAHNGDLPFEPSWLFESEKEPSSVVSPYLPHVNCVLAPCFLVLSFSPCAAVVAGLLVSPQPLWVEGKA